MKKSGVLIVLLAAGLLFHCQEGQKKREIDCKGVRIATMRFNIEDNAINFKVFNGSSRAIHAPASRLVARDGAFVADETGVKPLEHRIGTEEKYVLKFREGAANNDANGWVLEISPGGFEEGIAVCRMPAFQ